MVFGDSKFERQRSARIPSLAVAIGVLVYVNVFYRRGWTVQAFRVDTVACGPVVERRSGGSRRTRSYQECTITFSDSRRSLEEGDAPPVGDGVFPPLTETLTHPPIKDEFVNVYYNPHDLTTATMFEGYPVTLANFFLGTSVVALLVWLYFYP